MSSSSPSSQQKKSGPVMRVTGYDRASSVVMAAVLGLIVTVVLLLIAWASQHNWEDDSLVPLEVIDVAGGVAEGSRTETLKLETPFEEMPKPSLAQIRSQQTKVKPMLESVVDMAAQATDMARQQQSTDMANTGRPASSSGTGAAALGMGTGQGGVPRAKRWYIHFASGATTELYARQLDAFGIELGALMPGGMLIYLSNLSAGSPTIRKVQDGANENRLYFTWIGGGRSSADIKLFRKAGIDVGAAPIFHFYPQKTENQLARLELSYSDRPLKEIRRTYFTVERGGGGFEFAITRQVYFR